MSNKLFTVKSLALLLLICLIQSHGAKAYDFERSLAEYWKNDSISHTNPGYEKMGGIDINPMTFHTNELNYYRFVLNDMKDVISSPFHWQSKDWLRVGALAAGAGALILMDDKIYDFIQDQKTPFTKSITKFPLEPLGHYASFSIMAGMFTYGQLAKKGRPQASALLAAESYLIAGLLVRLPKFVFGRSRPEANTPADHLEWKGPGGGSSFWSGHTTTVFASASAIACMYNDKKGIQIGAYALAILAGLSRIHDEKHWSSDVLVGAVVGTAIGHLVVRNYKTRTLKVMPVISSDHQALTISYSF